MIAANTSVEHSNTRPRGGGQVADTYYETGDKKGPYWQNPLPHPKKNLAPLLVCITRSGPPLTALASGA